MTSSDEIVKRRQKTSLKNYGVTEPNRSDIVKDRIKKVFLKNYGVDNPSKAQIIKEQKLSTTRERFGVDHWTKVRDSLFATDNPMLGYKAENTKAKIRKTSLEKFGTENPSQAISVRKKMQKTFTERAKNGDYDSGYSRKRHVDKFGARHIVQGYEPQAIDYLSQDSSVIRIDSGSRLLPKIRYKLKDGDHFYHPDLCAYTQKSRHLVEVKSDLTIRCQTDIQEAKYKAAKKFMKRNNGTFWLLVVYTNGRVERFKNPSVYSVLDRLKLKPLSRK